jgi:hypothetical protein
MLTRSFEAIVFGPPLKLPGGFSATDVVVGIKIEMAVARPIASIRLVDLMFFGVVQGMSIFNFNP